MNAFNHFKTRIFTFRKSFCRLLLFLLCICTGLCFSACKKEIDYFSYVSEVCDNILLAKNETLSVRAYAVNRENPYLADGVPRERTARAEFFITVPSADKACEIAFEVNGKMFGGDTSYDNVKAQYYFSCSVDISSLKTLPLKITYGEDVHTLTMQSVKTDKTLKPRQLLESLRKEKSDVFTVLTDEYGFAGEIYIRLLYEEALYYYVGVIDRNGKTQAFLLNAQTGKILAQRQL